MEEGADSTPAPGEKVSTNTLDWKNDDNEESWKLRSDTMRDIIQNKWLNMLKRVIGAGWDICELLDLHLTTRQQLFGCRLSGEENEYRQTALLAAFEQIWPEGVEVLLDAGADFKFLIDEIAEKCLQKQSLELRDLDLDIGRVIFEYTKEPDWKTISLTYRYKVQYNQRSLRSTFLEVGNHPAQNPNLVVPVLTYLYTEIDDTLRNHTSYSRPRYSDDNKTISSKSAQLLQVLLNHGLDISGDMHPAKPILHVLIMMSSGHVCLFLQDYFNLAFQYGVDINGKDASGETAIQLAVTNGAHRDLIRWLIRCGASTNALNTIIFKQQRFDFMSIAILYILLQSGVPVSRPSVLLFLNELYKAIRAHFDNPFRDPEDYPFFFLVQNLWDKYRPKIQVNQGVSYPEVVISREYRLKQHSDLEDISDESLYDYSDHICIEALLDLNQYVGCVGDGVKKILDFLSEPHSLQWWCRYELRQRLRSLHPSVIKGLPIPGRLQRYVLCHEL